MSTEPPIAGGGAVLRRDLLALRPHPDPARLDDADVRPQPRAHAPAPLAPRAAAAPPVERPVADADLARALPPPPAPLPEAEPVAAPAKPGAPTLTAANPDALASSLERAARQGDDLVALDADD